MNITWAWSMPNKLTFKMKPVHQWILDLLPLQRQGFILDPFANRPSSYGAVTNDLNPEAETDYHMNALDFLKMYDDGSVNVLFFDPPYSPRQLKESYESIGHALTQHETQRFFADLKDEIARIMKPGGIVFSFGWNTVGVSASRGFIRESLLIVSHGGHHNDTLCLMERKSG